MIDVQVQNPAPLVNGLEIQPETVELFGTVEGEAQVRFPIHNTCCNGGFWQRKRYVAQLC